MVSPPVPVIVYASVWAQVLPAAALLFRRNDSRPVMVVAFTFLISAAGDYVGHVIGHRSGNSLWVSALTDLVTAPLVLFALADWQVTRTERLTVQIAVFPFVLMYCALLIWAENVGSFPKYAYPFVALVALGVSAWTLARRTLRYLETPVIRTDWFFVLGGLALLSATTAASTPIGGILLTRQRIDLFTLVWELRAWCTLGSILLVTYGALLRPADREAWA